jgi:twinkle protein
MKSNFGEIARLLAKRAEEVARYLLPNGKKEGHEWRAGSINGEAGESLGVRLTGDKAGVWADFAAEGGGDLLDLWAATRNLALLEAKNEAATYLGISQPKFEGHKALNFVRPLLKIAPMLPSNSPAMNYLVDERKLTQETINAFRIGQQGREIVFPYWRDSDLVLVKYLSLDRSISEQHPGGKKQIRVEPNCEPCLFGWHLVPARSRSITICEGELDAMSLYQYGVPALSVPFGGGRGDKHRWLEYEFDRLAAFDEIYLCFDMDEAGQAAVAELVERLGRYRSRIVGLPLKDANECLKAGISKEKIQEVFAAARTLDPDELKRASAYVDQVIAEFYPPNGIEIGITPPWEKARGKVLFRPDELSVWTGINGHGKSQVLGQVILHAIKGGARVCIASLELKPKRLLMRLTRQAAGLSSPTEAYIRAIHEWYGQQLWLFDLVGTAKSKRLLEVFRYARQRYGIDMFVIDSFMKLDIAEDDYKAQKAFIEELCDFKNEHNCHVHLVVHPRKSENETLPPGKLDNKGTGAISDLADNCFTVWRNKAKEEIKRQQAQGVPLNPKQLEQLKFCDALWICDKQRNGEWEGRISLWFDPASCQYLNHEKQKPAQFVEFSILNSTEKAYA